MAQVRVEPSGHGFAVEGNENLLEAALRAGLALDYGCSAGSCGQCKARIVSGQVVKLHHSDFALTAAEKTAGICLLCCNTAQTDLVIEAHEAHGAADMPLQTIDARIRSVSAIGEDMRLLHVQTPRTRRLRFLAGQSVSLELPGGCVASHAVASCPCDDRNLQFHVPRRPGDAFAERVFGELQSTDTVRIEGPRGKFVLNEESARPLRFIAWGTGFAPIKSLIEHALALDEAESLHLWRFAAGGSGHYLDNLCRSWSDALDNFHYSALIQDASLPADAAVQAALLQVLQDEPRLRECDVYAAAPEPLADAAEYLLLELGLPRSQLRIETLPA